MNSKEKNDLSRAIPIEDKTTGNAAFAPRSPAIEIPVKTTVLQDLPSTTSAEVLTGSSSSTTGNITIPPDPNDPLSDASSSSVVPISSKHPEMPEAPRTQEIMPDAGKTQLMPDRNAVEQMDMPEKTVVMSTDVSSGSVDNLDKTVVMPADGLTSALSATTQAHSTASAPRHATGSAAVDPQSLYHKRTLKQSLTATFRTGTLQIFDKTEDVDQVIHNHKSLPAKTALHKETDAPVGMDNVAANFEIGKSFAAGGQGILSVGTDLHLKRPVAIKSLRKELTDNEKQRGDFIAEARMTAQLDHPAIVPIYSLHTDKENGLHLAMKLINGENFKDYLNQIITRYRIDGIRHYDEKKSLRFRLEIFLKVCDALEYAHSRNIMHCDLKPENIMIGEYREAYLMDWGIARQIKEPDYDPATWVKPKNITGTPRFLTPEAIRGEHCDQRADIYAMGLILFEITTLTEAYTGVSPQDIVEKIRRRERNPLVHRFRYPIDTDLKAIIRKAASSKLERRYKSMRAFSADLRRYIRGEEVMAYPDSPLRKAIRWCSNHGKLTIITTLVVLLAAMASLAYNLYRSSMQERENSARREVISQSFLQCAGTAYLFDRKITELENKLMFFTNGLQFLLKNKMDTTVPSDVLPHENFVNEKLVPASFRYFAPYGYRLDFEHLCYRVLPTADTTTVAARVGKVAKLLPEIKKIISGSNFDTKDGGDQEAAMRRLKTQGAPISLVYLAFEDGLHFCYPGKMYDFSYDPRARVWYRERTQPDAPLSGWGEPYVNANKSDTVITYSVRMEDESGNLIGVTSMDLSLGKLLTGMENHELEEDFKVQEMTFLNEDGVVIVTTDTQLNNRAQTLYYSQMDNVSQHGMIYPDSTLFEKIKKYESGYVDMGLEDRAVFCIFTKCKTTRWYYLIKIDLTDALRNILNK